MSQVAAAHSVNPPPLWKNYSFHILWGVTFASGVGDRLIMVAALTMLGYGLEGAQSAQPQAGINFFFFLPYLLWSPIAGWLADILPRKWLMFASDELRGLIVLYAFIILPPGLTVVPPEERWQVWGLICLVGIMAATFVPAKLSSVPNVVGLEMLSRANAMVISMGIVGNLLGFLIGALVVRHSVGALILTSSLCYAVSGVFWIFLRTPFKPRESQGPALTSPWQAVRDIHAGMGYAWTHKPVRVLLLINAAVWGGVAVYNPALAVVNVELYGGGTSELQFLMAPLGVGMLLASAIFGLMNPRLGNEVLIALGLAMCGFFIILQMIVPVFGLGVAIALMTGIGGGTIFVPLYTLLARSTADHIRGRVFGAKEVIGESGQVIVSFLIWRSTEADDAMRPVAIVVASGLILMAVIGFWRYVTVGPIHSRILNALWRITRLYSDAVHKLKVVGKHHVPSKGPVLLISNHTAGIDPTLIQSGVPRAVRWMMAREYQLPGLAWFWKLYRPILVDRTAPDASAARAAVDALKAGEVVGLFPEGHINETRQGLLPLGPGVTLIARRTDAAIVPIHVSGTPRARHPLAGFFIPSRSRVVFGRPFRIDSQQGRDRDEILELVRRKLEEVGRETG
jgi:1-acyl-sn-glycerol-3-phosphate acyltransferase